MIALLNIRKSLNKFLNQYKAADEDSKDIAKRIIELETTQELQDEAITELATIVSESEV